MPGDRRGTGSKSVDKGLASAAGALCEGAPIAALLRSMRMGFAGSFRVAVAVACVVVGASCSGSQSDDAVVEDEASGATQSTSSDTLASVLEVADAVDLVCPGSPVQPPADFENVLDVVALPASPSYANALQTSVRDADDGSVSYFAKTGLWWRGDATFDIAVPAELRTTMAIGWGGPAQAAYTVRVDCGLSDSWMVMAGGYWVREPICAELVVRVGTKEQRVPIGLGGPCPGQAPPIGPSDG